MDILIKRFNKSLPLPEYDQGAAGFDLFCREDTVVAPGEIKLLPLNIAVKIPEGHVLLIFARSSTPWKKGLLVANGVGVVDPYYCGNKDEVLVEVYNFRAEPASIKRGERLVQGIVLKTENVRWNEVGTMLDRGHGGYIMETNKEETT